MGRSGAASGSETVWGQGGLSGRRYVTQLADRRFSEGIFFLLCNSCYWCASEMGGRLIKSCPACNHQLEQLPIAGGELFRFDYGQMRGVRLDF